MARFTKGNPKPANSGRKKGVKNKTTDEIRKALQQVLSNKVDELAGDLKTMSPFQQWMILDKVSNKVLPTLNKNDDSIAHSGSIKITVSFDDLGEDKSE
jgi:hypothetical protein